jgi:hypothetical protein
MVYQHSLFKFIQHFLRHESFFKMMLAIPRFLWYHLLKTKLLLGSVSTFLVCLEQCQEITTRLHGIAPLKTVLSTVTTVWISTLTEKESDKIYRNIDVR